MSWGSALGDAILTGHSLWDRDEQAAQEEQRQRRRAELQASLQRDLENLGASNAQALEQKRYENDTKLDDRRRTEAAAAAELQQGRDYVTSMDDATAFQNFLKPLPPKAQTQAWGKKHHGVTLDDDDLMTDEERTAAADADLAADEKREFRLSSARARGAATARPPFELQPREDPEFPRRLQGYLTELRTKQPTFEGALAAFSQTMQGAPDERFSFQKAARFLKDLYERPTGTGTPRPPTAAERALALATGDEDSSIGSEPAALHSTQARALQSPTTRPDLNKLAVGVTVTLKDGRRVRVKKVGPDGIEFD